MGTAARTPNQPLRPGIAVLAMVALLGVAALWVFHSWAWFEQRAWVPVTATVDDVAYHRGIRDRLHHRCPTGDGDGPRELHIAYRYEVGGETFTNDAYTHHHRSERYCDEQSARARMAELSQRGTLPIWVDPDDPQRAVMQRESGSEIITVFVLLFFAQVALVAFWFRLRRRFAAYEQQMQAFLDGETASSADV